LDKTASLSHSGLDPESRKHWEPGFPTTDFRNDKKYTAVFMAGTCPAKCKSCFQEGYRRLFIPMHYWLKDAELEILLRMFPDVPDKFLKLRHRIFKFHQGVLHFLIKLFVFDQTACNAFTRIYPLQNRR
jgi:hypothetical protein